MKAVIVILFAVLAVYVKSERPIPCICSRIYAPVCASNGKSYGNKCEFLCHVKSRPHEEQKSLYIVKFGACEEPADINELSEIPVVTLE
ncbi:ovomucoid-like [Tribolium madens]|uniref:ovomucoid-like n=1 Tax=Tribolium madens TaxID=41895 RepID=UPI001CF73DC2|nr:ovomucoid-like [Tribolium madens]